MGKYESFETAMDEVIDMFRDVFTGAQSKQSISVHFPRDGMSKDEILNLCNSEMSNAIMDSVYGLSPEGNLIALYIEPAPIDSNHIRLRKEDVRITIPIRFRHYYSLPYLNEYAELTEDEFKEKASSLSATYSEEDFEKWLERERAWPMLDSEDDKPDCDECDPFIGDWGDDYFDPRYDD